MSSQTRRIAVGIGVLGIVAAATMLQRRMSRERSPSAPLAEEYGADTRPPTGELPAPRAAFAPISSKKSATQSATREVVPNGSPFAPPLAAAELGADVADSSECMRSCGSECYLDTAGQLHCPKDCKSDASCPVGALCTSVKGGRRCLFSNCYGVDDSRSCGANQSCLYQGRLEGGIFRCSRTGAGRSGDYCVAAPPSGVPIVGQLCGAGLRCAAGTCLPGSCTTDGDCPRGNRCFAIAGGDQARSCVPACKNDSDCPQDQECYALPTGASICSMRNSKGCLKTGCSDGEACLLESSVSWDLRSRCAKLCNPGECGSNEHCWSPPNAKSASGCLPKCSSRIRCPDGLVCRTIENGENGCIPEPPSMARLKSAMPAEVLPAH
jgi:hypothetical protein